MNTRIAVFLLLLASASVTAAQTFQYPPGYVCGNGTIRARVTYASASWISIQITKTDGTCTAAKAFVANNTAYVRYDSATGAIAGQAQYRIGDPSVTINVPGFTSGRKTYYATIDSYWAGAIVITATSPVLPDLIGSYLARPSQVTAGQPFTIVGQVMNNSAATAGASDVAFRVGSTPGGAPVTQIGSTIPIGSLPPKASSAALSVQYTFPAAIKPGTYAVTIRADATNRIPEAQEGNNDYSPYAWITVVAAPVAGPLIEYRIGVVAFRNGMNGTQLRAMLADIVRDISNNTPQLEGNGRRVQLVVQFEIPWEATEPQEGRFDFAPYVDFARACSEKNVRWSVLLSPHYVPSWAADRYRYDKPVDAAGKVHEYRFMPFSASSDLWRVEAPRWIRAAISALANDAGRNHIGGAVSDVLVANEFQFPGSLQVSFDAATRRRRGTRSMTWSTEFRDWRAGEVADALVQMVRAAKDQMRALGRTVPVASKLVSYRFPPNDASISSYTVSSLATLNAEFDSMFAFDAYPKPYSGGNCGNAWTFNNDFAAARTYSSKAVYLSEFNYDFGTSTQPCTGRMSENDIAYTMRLARQNNVRYAVMFSWNSIPEDGNDHSIQNRADQKAGLRRAFFETVQ